MNKFLTVFPLVFLFGQAIAGPTWNVLKEPGSRMSVYTFSEGGDLTASVLMLNQATLGEFAYEIAYDVSQAENKNLPHQAFCENWRYVGSEKESIVFQVTQFYVFIPISAPWYQSMSQNLSKPKNSKEWGLESIRLCGIGEKKNVDVYTAYIPNSEKAAFTPHGLWTIGKILLSVDKSSNLLIFNLMGL